MSSGFTLPLSVKWVCIFIWQFIRGSKWADGGPDPIPLGNKKAIGLLSNICLDPLQINHKTTKPAFNDWLTSACLKWYCDPLSPHQLKRTSQLNPLWQNFLDPCMQFHEYLFANLVDILAWLLCNLVCTWMMIDCHVCYFLSVYAFWSSRQYVSHVGTFPGLNQD